MATMANGSVSPGFDIFIFNDNISFDKNLVFVSSTSNMVYMWMFQLRSLLMKGVSGVTKNTLITIRSTKPLFNTIFFILNSILIK